MTIKKSFNEIYESVYDKPNQYYDSILGEMKAFNKTASVGLGSPKGVEAEIGETKPGSLIVFFIDIRGFTKMSIALKNEELVKILQAITVASVVSIEQYGGHVIEFTGDGVMAYFGQGYTATAVDGFNTLSTSAFLMNGIKEVVNNHLNKLLDETVQVGIGIEYGNVLWTKIGTPDINQIKPISEVTFIAGKNSSQAKPWEVLMGKNIAEWVPISYKEEAETYKFQKSNKPYNYERFSFNWERFCKKSYENPYDLRKGFTNKVLPSIKPLIISNDGSLIPPASVKITSNGPRPLKDQPFF